MATLHAMTPAAYTTMERRAKRMKAGLEASFARHGVTASVLQVGSFFQYFFLPQLPTNFREAALDNKAKHSYLQIALANRGVHWRSTLTNCSLVMTDAMCDKALETFDEVLATWPYTD